MKSLHQRKVEAFMRKAGQEPPSKPCIPNAGTRLLRARLILEEALETITALGCKVQAESGTPVLTAELDESFIVKLDDIVDGCCDVSVVTIGTLSACGIPDMPVLDIVDENNLAKFGPGSYRRDDGKWIKPPGHKPPDFRPIF